jgi:RHS repeat-associated protein
VYDVAQGLPVVLADTVSGASAPPSRKYVWGAAGLAYAVGSDGSVAVYHADGLGSVRALTDGSGSVVQTYRTDAFGVPVAGGAQGSVSQRLQYAGEERDGDALVFLRARTYDPEQGRFLQRDRLAGATGDPQSLNRFAYAGNNPATLTDPSGLCVDPGGPGIRYCVDRFIPQARIAGGEGDNRGPQANEPESTYRIRQLIYRNADGSPAYDQDAGITRAFGREGKGTLEDCGARITKSKALEGGRLIAVGCVGRNGVLTAGFVPAIYHTAFIIERADGRADASVFGTPYPSMEIWQYGGPGGAPRLVFYFDAVRAGTNPVTDLLYPWTLPNHGQP